MVAIDFVWRHTQPELPGLPTVTATDALFGSTGVKCGARRTVGGNVCLRFEASSAHWGCKIVGGSRDERLDTGRDLLEALDTVDPNELCTIDRGRLHDVRTALDLDENVTI